MPASFLAAQNPRAEAVLPFLDYSQMIEEEPVEEKPCAILTGKERDPESGLDYFGARYYWNSAGRFTSPDPVAITKRRLLDPQSLNLYSYARNGPLNRVDPDGRDWYYYNDQWHWHKGNKGVTYTDAKGKEQAAQSRGTGLLVAETTGTNAKGATTYSLTLYDQNKVVATGNGFSGGRDELGRIHKSVRDGNYRILTDHDPTKPTAPRPGDPDNNPPVTYSMQQIDRTLNPYANAAFLAYGPIRARLNPLSGPDVGAYFHGQYNGRGWTHGCLSYGTDTRMIDYMWNSMPNTWVGVGVNEPVVEP